MNRNSKSKFVEGLNSKSCPCHYAQPILCKNTDLLTGICKNSLRNAIAHGTDAEDAGRTHLLDGDLQQLGISGHGV
jgi:hypothetical protein